MSRFALIPFLARVLGYHQHKWHVWEQYKQTTSQYGKPTSIRHFTVVLCKECGKLRSYSTTVE